MFFDQLPWQIRMLRRFPQLLNYINILHFYKHIFKSLRGLSRRRPLILWDPGHSSTRAATSHAPISALDMSECVIGVVANKDGTAKDTVPKVLDEEQKIIAITLKHWLMSFYRLDSKGLRKTFATNRWNTSKPLLPTNYAWGIPFWRKGELL